MYIEIFKILVMGLTFCFVFFLLWVSYMVKNFKKIDNEKIKEMSLFFNKLPIKKFFTLLSNNNLQKK